MSEYGVIAGPAVVRIERVLPGPIEKVWAYLTESDKRGLWLASGDMDLRPGGRVTLNFRHDGLSPHKEETPERYRTESGGISTEGRIIQCEPPRLLAFTWGGTSGEPSEVVFTLEPEADKVRLTVTHRRLPDRDEMISVASGWHLHLDILSDKLEGRTPGPFWSRHNQLEAEYQKMFPAS